MIHAFLITAYRDVSALEGLIDQVLKIKDAKIYINIDGRSHELIEKINIFIESKKESRIYLQFNKKIYWGGFEHLNMFMEMLSIAIKDQCEYFHTLTGQCRLTQPTKDFEDFFEKNRDLSFLEHFKLPTKSWPGNGGLNRIKFFQLYDLLDAKKPGKFFKRINKHFIHLQKLFFVNRLKNINYFGGSGYFSISKEAGNHLLNQFLAQRNHYKNTFCPEEIAPHSILMNSPPLISGNIVNDNLRYVFWESKNGEIPGILDESDFEKVQNKKIFFARKFDSVISKKLIETLEND
jgi:Core-2/I-Branching enzyme